MPHERNRLRSDAATTRRRFLKTGAAASAAVLAASVSAPAVGAAGAAGANERLGVGFIGCGGRSGSHMNVIRHLRDQQKVPVTHVAFCDAYRPRREAAAKKFGGKTYADYRDLLADASVDIVCIATPDHHHARQTIDAVRAGKDVYVEKPVTHWRQFDLLKQMAHAVADSGRAVQVGTQGMSDRVWHQMRRLVADGLIGRPIHADCGYFRVGDWGERGMRVDDPKARPGKDLDWEAFLGDAPKRDFDVSRFFCWRLYADYAGGPSTDLFPHSLTPVWHVLGFGFPEKVVATGGMFRYPDPPRDVPDTFNTLIDFPEKCTVAVLGTQGNNDPTSAGRGAGQRMPTVRGWDGSLTVEGKEIVFAPAQGVKDKPRQRIPIEQGENQGDHWMNLIQCVREGRRDLFSPMSLQYAVQTALIMGMWSLRDGKTARFDAKKEEIIL
ncbi:MAG: Gfo/Idh/MocA family oxidoreductase [Planctomycetes bacterium]|nr:Gfo/Idh/MocA family oxidoreductase [Planctomycetota bacterium]